MLGFALLVTAVTGCGLDEDLPQNPINVIAEPVSLRVQLPNGDTIERRQLAPMVMPPMPNGARCPSSSWRWGPSMGTGRKLRRLAQGGP
jgi:hypothetical protein